MSFAHLKNAALAARIARLEPRLRFTAHQEAAAIIAFEAGGADLSDAELRIRIHNFQVRFPKEFFEVDPALLGIVNEGRMAPRPRRKPRKKPTPPKTEPKPKRPLKRAFLPTVSTSHE